ncbi:MAG: hypothetical protein FH761_11335 [Firmicutes bacterium]|nr:hypothetical protein [Bacillota bacterium]
MVITCDISCSMGYIYVMPPKDDFNENSKSNVDEYIKDINLKIPYERSIDLGLILEKLKLSSKTYSEALEVIEINQEYCNDRDRNGYLIGIEMNLKAEDFIGLIKTKSFRVYETIWKEKEFYIATFDLYNIVFDENNVIYPLTKDNDTFVVVKVENKFNIGLIKAIVTCRNDIYPIEYFKKPQFIFLGEKQRNFEARQTSPNNVFAQGYSGEGEV